MGNSQSNEGYEDTTKYEKGPEKHLEGLGV